MRAWVLIVVAACGSSNAEDAEPDAPVHSGSGWWVTQRDRDLATPGNAAYVHDGC